MPPMRGSGLPHALTSQLAWMALLCVAALAFWPGLSGGFLFDDFANLPALGRYGGVHDLETLSYFLTSGIADPTGRPVAQLSFLLDARDWPADPWPFKRTNLLLHLCNAWLLFGLLTSLGRRLTSTDQHARSAAMLAAALWMLHPLWTSTVFYIVQRQAILAAFFVLCGLRAWVASQDAFDRGESGRGWLWAVLAVPVFGLLAGLGKANGFLLPLLLAALEVTVLSRRVANRPVVDPRAGRLARILLVWLPTTALAGWMAWHAASIGIDGNAGRPWTLGQRLMTQPRALADYLWHIFAPGIDAQGVFADGFAVSRDWFTPKTTLPAALLIGGLAACAWLLRRSQPITAAAIGVFLAGHAMESGVVMLELYFEHRNYLPAALLFWPLAWVATAKGPYRRLLVAGCIGYAGLMLTATALQAKLWSDPLALARQWALQNPDSARAQSYAAAREFAAGDVEAAEHRLQQLVQKRPEEPQFAVSLLELRCQTGTATPADIDAASTAIRASGGLGLDMTNQWMSATLRPGSGAACSRLPPAQLRQLASTALDSHQTTRAGEIELRSRVSNLRALLALTEHQCPAARKAFDERIAIQPRPEFVQSQVVLLATHCGALTARGHLQHYLDAGAPVARASSPALRLRDRLMDEKWSDHWRSLLRTLDRDIRNADQQAPHGKE